MENWRRPTRRPILLPCLFLVSTSICQSAGTAMSCWRRTPTARSRGRPNCGKAERLFVSSSLHCKAAERQPKPACSFAPTSSSRSGRLVQRANTAPDAGKLEDCHVFSCRSERTSRSKTGHATGLRCARNLAKNWVVAVCPRGSHRGTRHAADIRRWPLEFFGRRHLVSDLVEPRRSARRDRRNSANECSPIRASRSRPCPLKADMN